MSQQPTAAILTLGCKLNLADSREIGRGLRAAGYDIVEHMCEADAYVINTCSVTHVADQKSRRLIRSARRLSPHAKIAVTGCFPRSAGTEVAESIGADFVTGMRDADKAELVAALAAPVAPGPQLTVSTGEPRHTRAFVKAQEGCDDVCAFCIVPQTRGREASRTIEQVVAEVAAAVADGAREVVITGTQLGAWGRDLAAPLRPHHLIEAILEQTDVVRLRFSSLQPQDITPELLALWQDPRLMPHFHLALQSGSQRILELMRRRYSRGQFLDAAARIHAAVPGVAITTDIIAGFPGETEDDFHDTLSLCREARFARMHCFPYSKRSRTLAARMPDQVGAEVARVRMGELLGLGEELSVDFRSRFVGTVRPVLWEGLRVVDGESAWHGHTDNYIDVYADGKDLRNRVTPVLIGGVYHEGVRGMNPEASV